MGEIALASLKKSSIIQIQRKGYFIVDNVAPLTLIEIPDGHISKEAAAATKAFEVEKAAKAEKKNKKEKKEKKDKPNNESIN